jgi:hypothetical protein
VFPNHNYSSLEAPQYPLIDIAAAGRFTSWLTELGARVLPFPRPIVAAQLREILVKGQEVGRWVALPTLAERTYKVFAVMAACIVAIVFAASLCIMIVASVTWRVLGNSDAEHQSQPE